MTEVKDLEHVEIQPYSKKEMRAMYGNISRETFNSWLARIKDQIGPYDGKMYNLMQVEKIFNYLGRPYKE